MYGTGVIEQCCVFHTLRNVAHREQREQLLEQASAMYQAEMAAQANARLTTFVSTWQEQVPQAVATLQRNCEQTMASLPMMGSLANSCAPRPCWSLSSHQGAEVAIYLQM